MSSFKCVIPSLSLKVFGRAIQSLSKIGDELYIEPLEEGLFLRSVNSSRSAYACFQFAPGFFINYIDGADNVDDKSVEDGLRCKLGMKCVLAVFRNLSTIDKSVEKCKITLQMREAKLIFQLYCRHGIVKTHNLSFMETETLQAVFSKDLCPNKLTAEPKVLCDAVLNFQANQEEVTLVVRPDFVALKNYVEDESNPSRVVHTELTLVPDEFEHFQVGVDTDITFCLKEFRAVLAFADVTNMPLSFHFEGSGRPVTFSISSDLSFEANFVLATLADDGNDDGNKSPQRREQRKKNNSRLQASNRKGKNKSRALPSSSVSRNEDDNDQQDEDMEMAMMDIQDITVIDNRTTVVNNSNARSNPKNKNLNLFNSQNSQDNGIANIHQNASCQKRKTTSESENRERLSSSPTLTSHRLEDSDRFTKNPQDVNTFPGATSNGDNGGNDDSQAECHPNQGNTRKPSLKDQLQSQSEDESISPVIPIPANSNGISYLNGVGGEKESESEDEEITGTPPNKKFRSLFFGTQSSTQSTQQSQANAIVLAPGSDSDDY